MRRDTGVLGVWRWPRRRAAAAPARGAERWPTSSAELDVLDGQIEQLRDELVRSGAGGGLPTDPATALTRLDQLEAELRRLTDRVDVLTNDVAPDRRGRHQPGRRHRVPPDRARGRRHRRCSASPSRSAAA